MEAIFSITIYINIEDIISDIIEYDFRYYQ